MNTFSCEVPLPEFVQEADLREMMRFIKGEGKYQGMDLGIHTDLGTIQQKYCEKLETKGLIYRHANENNHTFWMPIETKESGNNE